MYDFQLLLGVSCRTATTGASESEPGVRSCAPWTFSDETTLPFSAIVILIENEVRLKMVADRGENFLLSLFPSMTLRPSSPVSMSLRLYQSLLIQVIFSLTNRCALQADKRCMNSFFSPASPPIKNRYWTAHSAHQLRQPPFHEYISEITQICIDKAKSRSHVSAIVTSG